MSTAELQSKRRSTLPVVEFATVPVDLTRDKWSSIRDDQRCEAAIRPWLNGGGQPNKWARCTRKKSHKDCLCGQHRNQAGLIGYVDWKHEKSRQLTDELQNKDQLLRMVLNAIGDEFVLSRVVFTEGSDCICFSINESNFKVSLNLSVKEIIDGKQVVSVASRLLRFALMSYEMSKEEKEGDCQ